MLKPCIRTYKNEILPASADTRVLLISGTHGDERTPIECLNLFIRENCESLLDNSIVCSVTVCNGINPRAIHENTRSYEPKPSNDLNRAFSDTYDPVKELKKLIDVNDIIIDIHSSPCCPEMVLIDNNRHASKIAYWCNQAKVPYLIRNFNGDTIKKYAFSKGKIGITFELNQMYYINETSAEQGAEYLVSLMDIPILEDVETTYEPSILVRSPFDGMIDVGAFASVIDVEKGTALANVYDFSSTKIGEILSPATGTYIYDLDGSYIRAGNIIGYIQPKPKCFI